MAAPLVQTVGICKRYRSGDRVVGAVSDLSLLIQQGEFVAVLGRSGSGKSTLMESIAVGLYGIDAARTKKDQIRTNGVLTDCELRMIFEHGGSTYEVRPIALYFGDQRQGSAA